jgi:hypothetical protein
MESGLLYVVFNKWICNPETHEMPYKIGITKYSITDRYYGLGLKMPGKFEAKFAYKIENYAEAEKAMGTIFKKNNINGEWYDLNEDDLNLIELNCKKMHGTLVTEEIENEIKKETGHIPVSGPTGRNGGDVPIDDKEKAYKELREIKSYFDAKGFNMKDPGTAFGKRHYISSIIRSIRSSGRRKIFGFAIAIFDNRYEFEYQTNDKEESKNMEEKFNEIRNLFPNATYTPGRGKEPWGRTRFEITDPREQVFNIIERTRSILGF